MCNINFSIESGVNTNYLVYKINANDNIDKIEHFMLTNNKIHGLLELKYTSIDGEYFYKYDMSSKVGLKRFLEGGIDRNKLLKILLSLKNVFLEIEDYMILSKHLILDENYVFVDVSSFSLHFVCLPIDSEKYVFSLNEFVKNIIYNLHFGEVDVNYMASLYKFLEAKDIIDISQIINIITQDSKKKNDNIGESKEKYEDNKLENRENRYNTNQNTNVKKADNIDKKNKIYDADETYETVKMDSIDFLIPNKKPTKNEEKSHPKNEGKLKKLFKLHNIKKKEATAEKKVANIHEIKYKNSEDDKNSENNHTILIHAADSTEETCLLQALNSGLFRINPYLIRSLTDEKIYINSDLFRIGKEVDYVDYAIFDNDTISRAHADIIKMNKDYYIQDNNSKNHTYVNNNMISDGQAIKLEHNFEIKLSDEKFIFKLY